MHAAPKADVPVADVHDIIQYDGFIFGFPTRYVPGCGVHRSATCADARSAGSENLAQRIPAFAIAFEFCRIFVRG